jgi:beta-barrel assembly-enhancing protease
VLVRAQWQLAEGGEAAWRTAAEALQTRVATQRQDAGAWQLLAQVNERLGRSLPAVRAEAESQAALGNLTGAIDRLRAGQRLARQPGAAPDFIELSVIDARLRDLLAERRQLQAEQREARGPRNRDEPVD